MMSASVPYGYSVSSNFAGSYDWRVVRYADGCVMAKGVCSSKRVARDYARTLARSYKLSDMGYPFVQPLIQGVK